MKKSDILNYAKHNVMDLINAWLGDGAMNTF
jgi:hypothetical protein